MRALPLAYFFLLLSLSLPVRSVPPEELPDFALLDTQGHRHEIRRADGQAVVIIFSTVGCPIIRQSIAKIKALQKKFESKGIAFWLVDPSPDDRAALEKEIQEFHIDPVPVLLDETQAVARLLGVTRTAEAIAISTHDWRIFYRGALDDQLSEGAQKPAATETFLENALNDFLAGKPITKASTTAHGCLITFDSAWGNHSYRKEVAPLIQSKCATCHSPGNIGPFAFSSHQKIKTRADMIREVVLTQRMPPWSADPHYGKFSNDCSLSKPETQTLLAWLDAGAVRDDGADPLSELPPPTPDWPLGPPDLVVRLPQPQEIPPTGVLDYRYVTVDSPFTNQTWVAGVMVRPQNRRVVHHVILRVQYPGQKNPMGREDAFLVGWAPGSAPALFPKETAKWIGPGAKFQFELHYNTSGKPETDQSEIGLYLAKSPPRYVLETRGAFNKGFEVSPGQARSDTVAIYGFKKESILFSLAPHMHLRGSWFRYEALYPNGGREVLLSVPNYDFNWQTTYQFEHPKKVPAGTWILCTGGFDNSTRNPHNPGPENRVRWGDQSFDEMFIGFMNVADTIKPDFTAHTRTR